MSIAIMDGDMSEYTLVPFNLEVMKLSAWYKKQREVVVLATDFNPEKYSKFIYRKDYSDGIYPDGLLFHDNVEYGGLAFSNNRYIQLPREIEIMHPDTSIYSRMRETILSTTSAERKKIYDNLSTAEHCRLSLDGKTIWDEYTRQLGYLGNCRNIIFHDYDLGLVDSALSEVKTILNRARNDGWATRVGMKFPVTVTDGDGLLGWSSLKTNSTFYSLRYKGFIDWDTFFAWVGNCKEHSVYSQMEYNCASWSAPYDQNQFLNEILPQIYRQIIFSRSCRVFFSLTYDDGYFKEPMWEKVIQLINLYHNSYASQGIPKYIKLLPTDTMYDFARHTDYDFSKRFYNKEKCLTKSEVREIFAFLRDVKSPLFTDFYTCDLNSIGGKYV